MRHFVYQIDIEGTELYYIGKRSTSKIDDKYLGSGTEILKYPVKQRILTVIETCQSSDEAYQREKIILGDRWKTDPACLNRKPGGKGAPTGPDHHWFGKPSAYQKRGQEHHAFGKKRSVEVCNSISMGQQQRSSETYLRGENHPGFGKPRSEKTKRLLSEKKTGVALGSFTEDHCNKISASLKKHVRPLITCPHCHRTMDQSNATRYHGDNCKLFSK